MKVLAFLLLVGVCVYGRFVQPDIDTLLFEEEQDLLHEDFPRLDYIKQFACDQNETERCTVDRWVAKQCVCDKIQCTCNVNPSPYSIVDGYLTMKCSYNGFHGKWDCRVSVGRCHREIFHQTIHRNFSSTMDESCIQKLDTDAIMNFCVIIECQDTKAEALPHGAVRGCARLHVEYDSITSGIKDTVDVNFGCFRLVR